MKTIKKELVIDLIRSHPNASEAEIVDIAITRDNEHKKPRIVIYAENPGPLIGPKGTIARELARQTGCSIEVKYSSEMPERKHREIQINKQRCLACNGSGINYRPTITLFGIQWEKVPCLLCSQQEGLDTENRQGDQ